MKKVLAVCLMLVVVMTMGISIFAETNGFVSSPSKNQAPEIVESDVEDLVVTPFSDKEDLPEEQRQKFNGAYDSIRTSASVSDLNAGIKDHAGNTDNLAVSDLFHIGTADGQGNDGRFNVSLNADTLDNFVCLLKYDGSEWTIVDGAKVVDGKLTFSDDEFSVYAVVVGSATSGTPQTGDNGIVYICAAVMVISAVALIVVWKKSKKQST